MCKKRLERAAKTKTGENEMKMTLREAEILCLIAQGFTNTEIGHKLHVTYKTVSNQSHKHNRKDGHREPHAACVLCSERWGMSHKRQLIMQLIMQGG